MNAAANRMKFITLIILLGLYWFPSAAASPENNLDIANTNDGSVFSISITDYGNKNNYNPQIWLHEDASKNKKVKYSYAKLLYKFDCKSRQMKLIEFVEYKMDGSVVNSGKSNPYSPFDNIVPESVGELFFVSACPDK